MNKFTLLTLSLVIGTVLPVYSQVIALKHINVIDVKALNIVTDQTVLIEEGIIKSVVNAQAAQFDNDVIEIDMTGKYVMPGLIDTHVHHATSPDNWDNDQVTRMRLRNLLRGGVTSVRDMGGDTRALSSLKRRAEIDAMQSPDIYYSVIIGGKEFFSDPRTIASAKGRQPGAVDWMRAVDEQTNFDEVMLKAKGTGATGIKIYAKVPATLIPKLELAAKKHGLKVWSHVFVGPAKPLELVNAGVETISHAPDMSAHVLDDFYQFRRGKGQVTEQQKKSVMELGRYKKLIAAMKAHNTIFDPTLTVFELHQNERGEKGKLMYQWGSAFTRLAHEHGVKVVTGTDGTSDSAHVAYPLVYKEMQLLVDDAGFKPLEAIQAATINGAEVIGIRDTHGTVTEGKVANLVIINQDPSDDIEKARDIAHVIKNGKFVYLGNSEELPFVSAKPAGGFLWLSGQLGNLPSTMTLAGDSIEAQMKQTMDNIGVVLQEYDLTFNDIAKCTIMLADIADWQAANKVYKPYFQSLPARSAFAATGLALGAKVEVECVADL